MNTLLLIFAICLLLAGFVGSVMPVVPGPPLGFVGLLVMNWSGFSDFSVGMLAGWGVAVAALTVADYYLPVWMTRRFGGSRAATVGSALGLLAGLFLFPPFGLVIGPFAGALIGQMITDGGGSPKAFRVAFGSFAAFILGTGAKLAVGTVFIFYAVRALF